MRAKPTALTKEDDGHGHKHEKQVDKGCDPITELTATKDDNDNENLEALVISLKAQIN